MSDSIRKHFTFAVIASLSMLLWNSTAIAQEQANTTAPKAAAHAEDGHHHTDADHSHEASTGHGDGHHEAYSIRSDLPFWSLIAFIGFVAAVKGLGLWDLLLNNMAEREKATGAVITAAESTLNQARADLRASKGRIETLDEKIRETLAEAQRDAETTRTQIHEVAQREAKASVERATLEIDRVRDQSLNEIFETLATKVTDVTESKLRTGLQPQDHDRLIGSMLEDLAIR